MAKRYHSGNWSKDVEGFDKAMEVKIGEQFKEKTGLEPEEVHHSLPVHKTGLIHTFDRTWTFKATAFGKVVELVEDKPQ